MCSSWVPGWQGRLKEDCLVTVSFPCFSRRRKESEAKTRTWRWGRRGWLGGINLFGEIPVVIWLFLPISPPPPIPAPRNLFFSDCSVDVGMRGEKCTGGCRGWGGGGGIKYYFYCRSLFSPLLFPCVWFCPRKCNSLVRTKQVFVLTLWRGWLWGLLTFFGMSHIPRVVGRLWLASTRWLTAPVVSNSDLVHAVSARGTQHPGL